MLPPDMISTCKKGGAHVPVPNNEHIVNAGSDGTINSASLSAQCGLRSICIIPSGVRLIMDGNVNVGALVVRGNVEWNDLKIHNIKLTINYFIPYMLSPWKFL